VVLCRRQHVQSKGNKAAQQHLCQLLSILVKAVSLLGMLAVAFGPPNAGLAIR
jgi:hypothetical protein